MWEITLDASRCLSCSLGNNMTRLLRCRYCSRPSLDDKGGRYLVWYAVKPYLLDMSWGCALGRFLDITTTGGITWALGENGKIYLSNHAKYVTLW